MILERARQLRKVIETLAKPLDDEQALANIELFPVWHEEIPYVIGDRVRYNDVLYKCVQAHTATDAWNPSIAVSLWAEVLIPDPEIIPDWVQPDSTNPYMKGDKVKHNNKVWESDIDYNVFEPGAIGTENLWHEVI